MEPKTIGILAILIAIIALLAGCWVVFNPPKNGEKGQTGPIGIAGATGPQGPIGATGPAGPAGTTGAIGPTGPAGATGPSGDDGQNLVCKPPVITAHTMDGLVGMCEPWKFSATIANDNDAACTDEMQVEMYLYVNTSWNKYMIQKIINSEIWLPHSCFDYNLADYKGDHFWYQMYNEVGTAGTYSFDWSAYRDVLGAWGFITPCEKFTWRIDITTCGCFISHTYTWQPDCAIYGGCGECCWICQAIQDNNQCWPICPMDHAPWYTCAK